MPRFRLVTTIACVALLGSLAAPAAATGGAASVGVADGVGAATDDASRGMVHGGLRANPRGGPCAGGFELGNTGTGRCAHGPDPAPPGVDVRRHRSVAALAADTAENAAVGSGSILCLGDGTSGNRVQAIYAVASDRTDRFASVSRLIPDWARATDGAFSASATQTGGERHVRWVTNPDCSLSVLRVTLSPLGDDSLDATETELMAMGFNRFDRKYLVWTDANVYCGIGGLYSDDRASQSNSNNGTRTPLFGRIDSGCWGRGGVDAHELMHTLGGVQLSAPNATTGFHCTDESDRMCYADGSSPSPVLTYVCPSSNEALFDCNHDDYFHTAPATGSYLATHWNTASSSFLTSTPAPAPDVTPPAVPTGLRATAGDGRVELAWSQVADSDLAGYRVRRDGTVVASVTTPSFTDIAATNGSTYTYSVSSYDVSGNRSADSSSVSATPAAPAPASTPPPDSAPPPAPARGPEPSPAPAPAPAPPGGYRLVATDGRSFGFGEGGDLGSTGALPVSPNVPVVDAAATPDGAGAWAVTATGAVHPIGAAGFHGSTAGIPLNKPVVGIASTPSGNGYWLVATDGGIFAFGDARFYGSTGAIKLNLPIVGMTSTPTGNGYWLVASDGGIFAFGDARFFGSTGAIRLNQPVVGMASAPSGNGYWLVASDGGIFAFGGAGFFGSTGAIKLNQPIVGMSSSATGAGYRFVAADGGVFSFGDARFLGSAAGYGASITAMVGPAR